MAFELNFEIQNTRSRRKPETQHGQHSPVDSGHVPVSPPPRTSSYPPVRAPASVHLGLFPVLVPSWGGVPLHPWASQPHCLWPRIHILSREMSFLRKSTPVVGAHESSVTTSVLVGLVCLPSFPWCELLEDTGCDSLVLCRVLSPQQISWVTFILIKDCRMKKER